MITIRPARLSDAASIGAVHVTAWRSAYPTILPDDYLTSLSATRMAVNYDRMIRRGGGVFVATVPGAVPGKTSIIGFAAAARSGRTALGEAEISLLYVLDDWRDQGAGRRLMQAAARHLADAGCRSLYLWVLRDNPSRWFYQRIGGRPVAEDITRFAGRNLMQTAFLWDPIDRLLTESTAP
jgi:GNAT superfamily N-acetyltransferase